MKEFKLVLDSNLINAKILSRSKFYDRFKEPPTPTQNIKNNFIFQPRRGLVQNKLDFFLVGVI